MTKRHVIIYTLLAIACIPAYLFGREIMIEQEPTGFVVTSNLTLNYILLFVLAGVISPWLSTKISLLSRFKRSTASGTVMLTLVSILLIILTLAGIDMRWSQ